MSFPPIFWVQLKMFAMFHSFWKLQNCMFWVCLFFPRHFWGFFGLVQFLLSNSFCRNKQREACNLGNGGSQLMLAKGPGSACQLLVVSSGHRTKLTTAPAAEPRLWLKARALPVPSYFPAKLLKKQQ